MKRRNKLAKDGIIVVSTTPTDNSNYHPRFRREKGTGLADSQSLITVKGQLPAPFHYLCTYTQPNKKEACVAQSAKTTDSCAQGAGEETGKFQTLAICLTARESKSS